jgi:hypothetical protein
VNHLAAGPHVRLPLQPVRIRLCCWKIATKFRLNSNWTAMNPIVVILIFVNCSLNFGNCNLNCEILIEIREIAVDLAKMHLEFSRFNPQVGRLQIQFGRLQQDLRSSRRCSADSCAISEGASKGCQIQIRICEIQYAIRRSASIPVKSQTRSRRSQMQYAKFNLFQRRLLTARDYRCIEPLF